MKKFFTDNKIFLILCLLFFIVGGILITTKEKGSEILYINSLHTPFFDYVFKYTTQLAELPIYILILVVALRFSYGKGFLLLLNCAIVALVIQFLKKIIFESQVRPSIFFEGKAQLNFVQGVEIAAQHSFPSGHTAAAFALFAMLAFLINNKKWSLVFFALAMMVGVSRVYLMQHFFRDVYAGAFIGVSISIIVYLVVFRSGFYQNLRWKDKALFR